LLLISDYPIINDPVKKDNLYFLNPPARVAENPY
jgi:hypothetical protein